ncbi:muscleblind-like protein 1 isoform X1 [Coturnix japonica]|uniref:muscleblind-like protein 1 isoform X1 n=1 Tax=Coturnix japonica TaxID=93934 RepID=UPI0013A5DA06|nr:muscleblind-like protein 1 isoform X1 [Coturnix japonica]
MRSCASPGPCRLPAPPDTRCPVAVLAVLLLGTELSHAELSVLDKNRHQPLRAAASPRSELRALHRAERALLLRSLRGAPGEAALQRERCVSAGGAAVPLHCRIPAALCPCLQHILQQSGRGCAVPALTVLSPPAHRAAPEPRAELGRALSAANRRSVGTSHTEQLRLSNETWGGFVFGVHSVHKCHLCVPIPRAPGGRCCCPTAPSAPCRPRWVPGWGRPQSCLFLKKVLGLGFKALAHPAWKEATVRCCTASAASPGTESVPTLTEETLLVCAIYLPTVLCSSWGSGHSCVGGGFNCTPSPDLCSEMGPGFPGPSSAICLPLLAAARALLANPLILCSSLLSSAPTSVPVSHSFSASPSFFDPCFFFRPPLLGYKIFVPHPLPGSLLPSPGPPRLSGLISTEEAQCTLSCK